MGVRQESVRISIQDDGATTTAARIAAALKLLEQSADSLDGTAIRANRSTQILGGPDGGLAKTAVAARRGSADLNQFTGRARALTEAALVLGPALLPIGAVAVPAVTALAGGLGAAVGAVGTAVLAFQGMGDALTALNEYQLEPTAENFTKLQEAMAELSPAARDFVTRLDELEPAFDSLRRTASEGIFPGFSEGLDELVTMFPLVRDVVSQLSTTMGDLAADGGAALANDDDWQAFFDFIRTDAAPTLDAFARATGNVVAGVGNMLVAFAPLSRDATSEMLDMSRAFREWSADLDENAGFQEFVDYIRENGPAVGDFFGAVGSALVGVAEAAAPWGSVVLPVLTAVADVFGALASSPIGPPLFTAAAAMVAIGRTAGALNAASGALGKVGINGERASKGLAGLAGKAGAMLLVGQAIGSAVDAMDLGNKINTADLARDIEAITTGFSTGSLDKLSESLEDVNERGAGTVNSLLALPSTLFGIETSFAQGKNTIDAFDQQLAQLVEGGKADEAAALFERIRAAAAEHGGVSDEDVVKSFDSYKRALDNAATSAGPAADGIEAVGDAAEGSSDSVERLSTSIAELSGWLDKRSAFRNYEESIDSFTESLKENGRSFDIATAKGRANQAALDNVASSVAQVAEQIKSPVARQNFINAAIADLQGMARNAAPQARSAIQDVIGRLRNLAGTKATPKVEIQGVQQALDAIASVKTSMANVRDKTTRLTLETFYTSVGKPSGPQPDPTLGGLVRPKGQADGGTVPKTGRPYADRHLYLLADGEEVVSNRNGQADKNRAALKAANAGAKLAVVGYADGGTVGGAYFDPVGRRRGSTLLFSGLDREAAMAAQALAALTANSEALGKQYDHLQGVLSDITQQRQSLESSVLGQLTPDWFGETNAWSSSAAAGSPTAFLAAADQATAKANELRGLIGTLKGKGVSEQVLGLLIEEGGIDALRAWANSPDATVQAASAAYATFLGAAGTTAAYAGATVFGAAEAAAAADVAAMKRATESAAATLERMEKQAERLAERRDKVLENVGPAAGNAAAQGTDKRVRDGKNGQKRNRGMRG